MGGEQHHTCSRKHRRRHLSRVIRPRGPAGRSLSSHRLSWTRRAMKSLATPSPQTDPYDGKGVGAIAYQDVNTQTTRHQQSREGEEKGGREEVKLL